MSISGQKMKSDENNKTGYFSCSDDEVELLLNVAIKLSAKLQNRLWLKLFSIHIKTHSWCFQIIIYLLSTMFSKSSVFCRQFIRPYCRDKVTFSNLSGVVLTWPENYLFLMLSVIKKLILKINGNRLNLNFAPTENVK